MSGVIKGRLLRLGKLVVLIGLRSGRRGVRSIWLKGLDVSISLCIHGPLQCGLEGGTGRYAGNVFGNHADEEIVQPLDIIKSPMILLALFSMALVFGMPYLMENSKSHSHVL